MIDFTSALYLGFHHASETVRPWSQLTTGVPAALAQPQVAKTVARKMAQLQGCEQATIGPSTLHLFGDLFEWLAKRPITIYLDAGAYPIAQWGIERAALRGTPVRRFPQHDVSVLSDIMAQHAEPRQPVIVSDGLCTSCGCSAPLVDYLELARHHNGLLILDDTQALGLLGYAPDLYPTYGRGGGGTLRHQAIRGAEIIMVSSLAKSFGVPLAVLSGSRPIVMQFERHSKTRVHCSPPSLVNLHAAERALAINESQGDTRRQQLAQNIDLFRQRLNGVGLTPSGGLFPIQTVPLPHSIKATEMQQKLWEYGIRAMVRRSCNNGRLVLSMVVTARHQREEIKYAADTLISIVSAKQYAYR